MYKQTALEKRGGNFNGCSLIYISMCKKLTHHQMPQWGQQKKNMSKAPVSHHCVLVPARFRRCFHVWWHHIESIRDRCKERDGNPCCVYLQTPPAPQAACSPQPQSQEGSRVMWILFKQLHLIWRNCCCLLSPT